MKLLEIKHLNDTRFSDEQNLGFSKLTYSNGKNEILKAHFTYLFNDFLLFNNLDFDTFGKYINTFGNMFSKLADKNKELIIKNIKAGTATSIHQLRNILFQMIKDATPEVMQSVLVNNTHRLEDTLIILVQMLTTNSPTYFNNKPSKDVMDIAMKVNTKHLTQAMGKGYKPTNQEISQLLSDVNYINQYSKYHYDNLVTTIFPGNTLLANKWIRYGDKHREIE
jgi:hypothetical protein